MRLRIVAVLLVTLAPVLASAGTAGPRLDWELDERPAGPGVTWLRGVRDGSLGLFDAFFDLQLVIFSELALGVGVGLMAVSDGVGIVDDNPVTKYVLKAQVSKSIAKPAYLFHLAGAEAVLGSHGLEREWYLEASLVELSPLVDSSDAGPAIPLPPLAFVEDAYLHTDVYKAWFPGRLLVLGAYCDVGVRPAASLVRIVGFHGQADALERHSTRVMRRALE